MKGMRWAGGLLLLGLATSGCGDDATGPRNAACAPGTAEVEPQVTVGSAVVFDWSPACGVALLLIEEGAGDMWSVQTDEETWDDPAAANGILPPVTYGTVPAGAESWNAPEPLVAGRTYELILWRVLPSGEAALVAVHEFVR